MEQRKISIRILIAALLITAGSGCTLEENKIDHIYGEWRVQEVKSGSANGDQTYEQTEEYFIDFDTDNRGILYDQARMQTNTIQWGYQFAGDPDQFMISIQLENASGTSDLAFNTIYDVRRLEEEEFLLTKQVTRISNDTTFITYLDLNMTRI